MVRYKSLELFKTEIKKVEALDIYSIVSTMKDTRIRIEKEWKNRKKSIKELQQ